MGACSLLLAHFFFLFPQPFRSLHDESEAVSAVENRRAALAFCPWSAGEVGGWPEFDGGKFGPCPDDPAFSFHVFLMKEMNLGLGAMVGLPGRGRRWANWPLKGSRGTARLSGGKKGNDGLSPGFGRLVLIRADPF